MSQFCSQRVAGSVLLYVAGTEIRFVSGIGEEVDKGYLETGTNLVSVVSTLFLFPFSYRHTPAMLFCSIMCQIGL